MQKFENWGPQRKLEGYWVMMGLETTGPTEILEHVSHFISICPRQSFTKMAWSVLGSERYAGAPQLSPTFHPLAAGSLGDLGSLTH